MRDGTEAVSRLNTTGRAPRDLRSGKLAQISISAVMFQGTQMIYWRIGGQDAPGRIDPGAAKRTESCPRCEQRMSRAGTTYWSSFRTTDTTSSPSAVAKRAKCRETLPPPPKTRNFIVRVGVGSSLARVDVSVSNRKRDVQRCREMRRHVASYYCAMTP